MSVHLIIGYLDNEVTDVISYFMLPEAIEKHFPLGEVYRYGEESGSMQWRVLQRSTRVKRKETSDGFIGTWAALLPIKPEDVPEIVRMTALMAT